VEFYSPRCGACRSLAPAWTKVATSLKGVVKVAAVNCEQHQALCRERVCALVPRVPACFVCTPAVCLPAVCLPAVPVYLSTCLSALCLFAFPVSICLSICLPAYFYTHTTRHSPTAQGVQAYPTLLALQPGGKKWQEYGGNSHGAGALSTWATGLLGKASAQLANADDTAALLSRCGGGAAAARGRRSSSSSSSSSSAAQQQGSWGVCLVLVSSRDGDAPPLWRSLAAAFKGKAALGHAAAGGAAAAALGAPAVLAPGERSAVITICNGDVRTAERYTGGVCGGGPDGRVHVLSDDVPPSPLSPPHRHSHGRTQWLYTPFVRHVCSLNSRLCLNSLLSSSPSCALAGTMKSDPLQRHISGYSGGRKCASQVCHWMCHIACSATTPAHAQTYHLALPSHHSKPHLSTHTRTRAAVLPVRRWCWMPPRTCPPSGWCSSRRSPHQRGSPALAARKRQTTLPRCVAGWTRSSSSSSPGRQG
jgi:thiol-disulfide isomerase/thioredoxin